LCWSSGAIKIVAMGAVGLKDSDVRPDIELADMSNHLKRERSIIVALFTGQYKSLLTCRTCKYESARFEPFSFLQLPLPEDEHVSVSLTFYSANEGVGLLRTVCE
jgi:ubiquitin C-terminal hydrolase